MIDFIWLIDSSTKVLGRLDHLMSIAAVALHQQLRLQLPSRALNCLISPGGPATSMRNHLLDAWISQYLSVVPRPPGRREYCTAFVTSSWQSTLERPQILMNSRISTIELYPYKNFRENYLFGTETNQFSIFDTKNFELSYLALSWNFLSQMAPSIWATNDVKWLTKWRECPYL